VNKKISNSINTFIETQHITQVEKTLFFGIIIDYDFSRCLHIQ